MIEKKWVTRRAVALGLLVPGYLVGWICARVIPVVLPGIDWVAVSPYTVGAIGSTVFNLILWDRFVRLVFRFGGKSNLSQLQAHEAES